MQPKHVIVLFVIGIVALVLVAGANLSSPKQYDNLLPADESVPPTGSAPTAEAAPAVTYSDVEVLDWDFQHGDYGTVSIVGRARNRTDRTFEYAEVEFKLLDESGAQVGTAMDNITNLSPGIWRFEAVILEQNVAQAQLASLSVVP